MAASYDFVQLDVFTRMPLAGNPLAIFTDARGLTDKQMQALTREMNLSETTFILPREVVTVAKIKPSGAIRLEDGRVLPSTYRQFVRGYAVTSYGSQGKTVDHVLFSDSAFAQQPTRSNGTSPFHAAERASKSSRPTSNNSVRQFCAAASESSRSISCPRAPTAMAYDDRYFVRFDADASSRGGSAPAQCAPGAVRS